MSRKRTNWQATLGRFEIHTRTGREQFLNEIARAYEGMYPERAAFFKRQLRLLKQVSTGGYQAGRNGEMYCRVRVPTELWIFVQRWIPDFGRDSADLELLCRVWCDLVRVYRKDPRRRAQLFVTGGHRRVQQPCPASQA